MAKKNFNQGIDSMLGGKNTEEKKESPLSKRTSAEKGTKEGDTRATFIVQKDLLEKSKALAYWERMKYKDVINAALEEYISNYEKKNGPLKAVPEK